MIDVDFSLKRNRVSNDFVKLSNKYAIASKIKAILLLRRNDVTYRDYMFSTLSDLIGENMTPSLAVIIKENISFTLEKFVPEITVVKINIGLNYDTQTIEIRLVYSINETNETVEQSIVLESGN